jgi:hypothetical protein
MDKEESVSGITSSTPAITSHKTRNFGILAVIVIVVGILVIWFLYFKPLPADLRNATYIGFDQTSGMTRAYRRAGDSFTAVIIPDMTVSLAASRNGYAAITQDTKSFHLYFDNHELGVSTTTEANVSISSDARWMGVSWAKRFATSSMPVQTEEAVGVGDPNWRARIFDLSAPTPKSQSLDLGFSPVFTDATHVVWLSPRGLTGMDLATGMETLLAALNPLSVSGPLLASPDGKTVAFFDEPAKSMAVYRVTATSAALLAHPQQDKKTGPISYVLGNASLYSVRINLKTKATEIWSTPFNVGTSKLIESIPASYRITRLTLPSSL